MNEMVERVAKAIAKARECEPTEEQAASCIGAHDDMPCVCLLAARAAIAALREPTEAMIRGAAAGLMRLIDQTPELERGALWGVHTKHGGYRIPRDQKARARYQGMIDAALGNPYIRPGSPTRPARESVLTADMIAEWLGLASLEQVLAIHDLAHAAMSDRFGRGVRPSRGKLNSARDVIDFTP